MLGFFSCFLQKDENGSVLLSGFLNFLKLYFFILFVALKYDDVRERSEFIISLG